MLNDTGDGGLMLAGKSGSYVLSCPRTIAALLFAAALLLSGHSGASCIDPTQCYCGLAPESDDVIVRAEVIWADVSTVSIRILGAPFYNPDGLVVSGQVLEDLTFQRTIHLAAGDVCLFRIPGSLDRVAFYVLEEGGKYRCRYIPDFPGLDMIELAQLALSGDCQINAMALLDLDGYCKDVISGCCNSERTTFQQPAGFLLILGAIRFRKKRKNSRTEV